MRRNAHASYRMGMQCCIEVGTALEQPGMDDQRATLDPRHIGIGYDVSVEIDLQQRGSGYLRKHPIGALDEHTVRLTGDPKPEMIVGQVIDAVMRQDAMTG